MKQLFRASGSGARKRHTNDYILRKYRHPTSGRVIQKAAQACKQFETKLVATSEIVNRIFTRERFKKVLDSKPRKQKELWQRALGQLLQLGSSSEGNHVELYTKGDEYFTALWSAFRHAEDEILFECYMLRNDKVSYRTVQELCAASLRGVHVRMVYDAVGASELPYLYKDDLRQAGVDVREYNPIGIRSFLQGSPRRIFFRNHKKTTIVDKKVAFVGGMNVTSEYCTQNIDGGIDRFRDTHAMICGPAVDDIRQNFLDSYADVNPEPSDDDLAEEPQAMPRLEALCSRIYRIPQRVMDDTEARTKNSIEQLKLNMKKLKHIGSELPNSVRDLATEHTGFTNGTMVQVLQSWRHSTGRNIPSAVGEALRTSSRAVKITNPYFLPPPKMKKYILDAASRGVDVKVITCRNSDVPIMAHASRHLYQDFIGSGVRIFEYKKKVLHSKTMIVDDVFSTFGSWNFDDWSYRRNLELNIFMMDPDKAEELTAHFEEDLIDSEEITLDCLESRGAFSRLWYFTAYQAARLPKRLEGGCLKNDNALCFSSLSYPKASSHPPRPAVS